MIDQRAVNKALYELDEARDAHGHQVRLCFGAAFLVLLWLGAVAVFVLTAVWTDSHFVQDLMIFLLICSCFAAVGLGYLNVSVNEKRGRTRRQVRVATREHADTLVEDEG